MSAMSTMPMIEEAKPAMAPREDTSVNPCAALRPKAFMLGNPFVVETFLAGVILPIDREKVDKVSLNKVVTNFF
ncbi:hypothetical protein Acr_20g0004580 [Actinidia rufa]|uniref:Uncharacterized protein n=1 Tax=Actinidia rufa TaxID=165716 RepID=A0A7J0GCX6_9ERIC|nr:hypothetical protein Acr_20g0004580 [Actinidia rufa]